MKKSYSFCEPTQAGDSAPDRNSCHRTYYFLKYIMLISPVTSTSLGAALDVSK